MCIVRGSKYVSWLQRTTTTRPTESERELTLVNSMCELNSGNREFPSGNHSNVLFGDDSVGPLDGFWPFSIEVAQNVPRKFIRREKFF
jgi:hypothetical protein